MQRRDRYVVQSLGVSLTRRIKDSRVLLVGAGGIGCELLKNLVCCGFGTTSKSTNDQSLQEPHQTPQKQAEIVVVDLDTIDLSNLNRQFLFRKQHIKRSKADVAKETASQFNPAARIDAQHASIFDQQYTVDFFKSFDLVFNALDNLAARRHVNRMCLAANVPLIESGTTGFNGQVQVIQKGITECYDCNPKPIQKSFPICTIRSTPSQPIHSIVWAKSYLLPELFGASEDTESSSNVVVTAEDNAEEVAKLQEEAEALKKIRAHMGTSNFAKEVFNKVFRDDIERLRSMKEMWQTRRPPESLGFESLSLEDEDLGTVGKLLSNNDQITWDLQQNATIFRYSIDILSQRIAAGETAIEFDKDDKDTLDFVASAANLRSHIFGIPQHSEWEIKQMAGNIIPAIATSNALTASLCVLEAFKILKSLPDVSNDGITHDLITRNGTTAATLGGAKMVFLNSRSTDRMILPQELVKPNPHCAVCSPVYARLSIPDAGAHTLQDLVDLIKSSADLDEFSVVTDAGIIYDPDLEDNLEKSLTELAITAQSNSFVIVTDDGDAPRVDLVLSMCEAQSIEQGGEASQSGLSLLPAHISLPHKPEKPTEENPSTNGALVNDAEAASLGKRKRDADDEEASQTKKVKAGNDTQAVVIEDDGAIVLDD